MIVASPYISQKPIDHRDFWNICGRAGRAFVDREGKILYAIDEMEKNNRKIQKNYALANNYFNAAKSNPVKSGLLYVVDEIYKIARSVGIDFSHLLEMIAENDYSRLGQNGEQRCIEIMDMIDD